MQHCMWGRGPRENNGTCSALSWLPDTSPTTHKQIGPFWCLFPGGWFCVHSRSPCVSPTNPPVRLGVSPATTTPRGFDNLRFWSFISPCWNPQLHSLSHSPVVPPGLSTHKCGTAWSTTCHLVIHPLCPGFWSLALLLVWMNVSFLTPWLSDFHTVQFPGSSGCSFPPPQYVVLLLAVWRSKTYLPMPPSWPEVCFFLNFFLQWSSTGLLPPSWSLFLLLYFSCYYSKWDFPP